MENEALTILDDLMLAPSWHKHGSLNSQTMTIMIVFQLFAAHCFEPVPSMHQRHSHCCLVDGPTLQTQGIHPSRNFTRESQCWQTQEMEIPCMEPEGSAAVVVTRNPLFSMVLMRAKKPHRQLSVRKSSSSPQKGLT